MYPMEFMRTSGLVFYSHHNLRDEKLNEEIYQVERRTIFFKVLNSKNGKQKKCESDSYCPDFSHKPERYIWAYLLIPLKEDHLSRLSRLMNRLQKNARAIVRGTGIAGGDAN